MARNTGVPSSLFASPRITVENLRPGAPSDGMVLRSAETLGDYPATVVHSLRDRARAAPGHLMVAERHRDPAAGRRGCGYGAAGCWQVVFAPTESPQVRVHEDAPQETHGQTDLPGTRRHRC